MRTSLVCRSVTVVLCLALSAGFALSQTTLKTQNGVEQGGFYALLDHDVQADLGLSAKQLERIEKVKFDMQRDMSVTIGAMLSSTGRDLDMEEIGKAIERHNKKSTSSALKILTKSQRARFTQIELQLQDGLALTRQDVQKKLGLSKSQKSRIKSIANASGERDGAQSRSVTTTQQMQQKKKAQNQRLLAVLTKSQLTKFDDLKGKPLKRTKGK